MCVSKEFWSKFLNAVSISCLACMFLLVLDRPEKAMAVGDCDPPNQNYRFGLVYCPPVPPECPDASIGFRCISQTSCQCSYYSGWCPCEN